MFPSYEAAQVRADSLNEDLRLDRLTAYKIVTSSIRAENIREQNTKRCWKQTAPAPFVCGTQYGTI